MNKVEKTVSESAQQASIVTYSHVHFALRDKQRLDGSDEVLAEVGNVDMALVEHLVVVPHVNGVAEARTQLTHVLRTTHTRGLLPFDYPSSRSSGHSHRGVLVPQHIDQSVFTCPFR